MMVVLAVIVFVLDMFKCVIVVESGLLIVVC